MCWFQAQLMFSYLWKKRNRFEVKLTESTDFLVFCPIFLRPASWWPHSKRCGKWRTTRGLVSLNHADQQLQKNIVINFFVSPKWLMELGNKDNKAGPEPNQRNSAAYCFFVIYKFSCCIWSLSSFGMLFNDFETLLRKYFLLSLPSIFLQNFQTENLISVPSLPLELNPFEGKLCKCKSKCTKQLCAIEPEWF